ncbi:MAG TPA: class I SAM-dependent methyltransferase [Pyrinomonadaceae bacterium]|nr:class I SAM-dependent methyltransferase [Pyrinomonadaceae bacterium]
MTNNSTQTVGEKVRAHFHEDAERFDAIYDEKKSFFSRFIDNYWRGIVQRRLELNVEHLMPLAGKKVLDVGCGSGRFCIAFAQNGAERVVGIDFARAMVELAEKLAKEAGIDDRCEFIVGSFPEALDESDRPFDACTANGFFDYIEHPVPIITAMRELTKGQLIMSFPKAREWRVPVRRFRFWLKGTPLFLYREVQVRGILKESGVTDYNLIHLDRDYLVVADV